MPVDFTIKEKRKHHGCLLPIVLSLVFLAIVILGVSNSDSSTISEALPPKSTELTAEELLYIEGHPKLFDKYEDVKNFYEDIGDDRVRVMTISDHAQRIREIGGEFEDDTVLYFLQDSTIGQYAGLLSINIFDSEIASDMDIGSAVALIAQYLPNDFLQYYQLDCSYVYGNEDTEIYVYASRLNDDGVNHHNDSNPQYSYYYGFRISHYIDKNYWILETDYAPYGGRGAEWAERYASPWEIDLAQYMQ